MTKEEKYKEAQDRVKLKMKQWETVEHGDTEEAVEMAIFLGKQYLGQSENPGEDSSENVRELFDKEEKRNE